jgi:ATP-dependent RNA helicase DOB1
LHYLYIYINKHVCVCMGVVESLTEADRGLLQVVGLKPLLVRGIGVHHSGLIPILREIVELLFQENLIQVLFSTGMV